MTQSSSNAPSIGERVKFWEEQDRINQELIPRVIRQHELFTAHIADHENLPLIAGNAISAALADAREEQRQQHEAALEVSRMEREEQNRQHQLALQTTLDNMQAMLATHQIELSQQSQSELNRALTELQEHTRKMRNLVIGIATGAAAISIAAVIAAIAI